MSGPTVPRDAAAAFYRNLLRPAVEQLAWGADQQIAWMERQQVDADEFALDLENAFEASWQVREWGWLSDEAFETLAEMDALFEAMSGPQPERWTEDALRNGEDWRRIRELARQALALMPEVQNDDTAEFP